MKNSLLVVATFPSPAGDFYCIIFVSARVLLLFSFHEKENAEIDLLSVENGGVEVACSNHHYGEPKNMIKVRPALLPAVPKR